MASRHPVGLPQFMHTMIEVLIGADGAGCPPFRAFADALP